MSYSDEELLEVHANINGKITDYDILKNVPTIDGVPVHGDITDSGKYTDETPTAGSKKLITSGAMRAAMERGDLQGPGGKDGFSPRIEVVNIGSGYRVNITDIDGTKYFDVIICGDNTPGTHTHDERYYTEAETEEKLAGKSNVGHSHNDLYYTEAETENLIRESEGRSQLLILDLSSQTDTKLSGKSDTNHTHDGRYYTEAETDTLLSGKSDTSHTHDGRYYTEAETDSLLSGKSDTSHVHDDSYYKKAETDSLLSGKSNTSHNHDVRYYTEGETDTLLAGKSDTSHTHDGRYYTETETNSLLAGKSDKNHNHDGSYCTESRVEELIGNAVNDAEGYMQELASQLSGKSDTSHTHDGRYYTEAETDSLLLGKSDTSHVHDDRYYKKSETDTLLSGKSNTSHTHDERYYTESETDKLIAASELKAQQLVVELDSDTAEKLSGKSDTSHTHDGRYYTETETDSLLSGKSNTSHNHDGSYYKKAETDSLLAGKSDTSHTHDGRYYTEAETDSLISKTELKAQQLVAELDSSKSDTGHQHWYLEPQGGGNTVMVTSDGNLYPLVHEGQQLGTTARRWSYILGKYVVGSAEVNGPVVNATTQVNSPKFNNTSDERVKENFNTDMAKYVAMLDLLVPTSYHFKSEADMEDRKRNVGYIAQRVQEAMAEVGLDVTDFGGLCYDTERESKGEFSYGLAYSQFIPILHAKLKQVEEKYDAKIAEYDKKIAELEEKLAMYLSSN